MDAPLESRLSPFLAGWERALIGVEKLQSNRLPPYRQQRADYLDTAYGGGVRYALGKNALWVAAGVGTIGVAGGLLYFVS